MRRGQHRDGPDLDKEADRRGAPGLEPVDDEAEDETADQCHDGVDADGQRGIDRRAAAFGAGAHQRYEMGEEAYLGEKHEGEGRGNAPEMPLPQRCQTFRPYSRRLGRQRAPAHEQGDGAGGDDDADQHEKPLRPGEPERRNRREQDRSDRETGNRRAAQGEVEGEPALAVEPLSDGGGDRRDAGRVPARRHDDVERDQLPGLRDRWQQQQRRSGDREARQEHGPRTEAADRLGDARQQEGA